MDSTGRFWAAGERLVYDGTEFGVSQLYLMLPDGDELPWHVVRLGQSASVVLADKDGRVLLVRRYRPGLNRWGWELPGDRVEPDEDPSQTVTRELEEAGHRAGELDLVMSFQPEPHSADGEHLIFAARDSEPIQDTDLSVHAAPSLWVPADSVAELIAAGEIWSAATLIGLLRHATR